MMQRLALFGQMFTTWLEENPMKGFGLLALMSVLTLTFTVLVDQLL